MICRLKKSLYVLKASVKIVVQEVDSFMVTHGYQRTDTYHCVYVRKFTNGKFIIILLYADDILIVRQNSRMIGKLKEEMVKTFDMKDLGPA